ncbi:MAG: peptide-methionine (R)-S-oxide reductase MsrB [Proteobacteria bacterium]|nr:peptide-methionine (R)-S-oxide reductase [Pseudomonadota bacterium]NOG60679.1 peptide-methionine (R)-S-oxide reductase MsrB [Pseudomonadota bacterium]
MQRRQFIFHTSALAGVFLMAGSKVIMAHPINKSLDLAPLDKPHNEWKNLISKQAFHILFEEGTERPDSSSLNNVKVDGTFICAACYLPLFEFETKYDSGTGWPSFYQPIKGRIETKLDLKLVWPRTEYHCIRCMGHQGHVFEDGPEPTGLRYCNNGLALKFIPANKALPDLRG